ncbi:MAG: DUF2306 domain-containing protein [Brachymonas sp.]|nr:DUF2306 domain-containing protein [Brachymonas sp.]
MHTFTNLSPQLSIHLFAMLAATLIGPLAMLARWRTQRPRLHRALGYAWVTLMLTAAISALFIRSTFPLIGTFSWIHVIFIPSTLVGLFAAFWFLARKNIRAHRLTMIQLYIGSCLIAGAFTLSPGRLLGHWLWG